MFSRSVFLLLSITISQRAPNPQIQSNNSKMTNNPPSGLDATRSCAGEDGAQRLTGMPSTLQHRAHKGHNFFSDPPKYRPNPTGLTQAKRPFTAMGVLYDFGPKSTGLKRVLKVKHILKYLAESGGL